jgi:hypothetical protein
MVRLSEHPSIPQRAEVKLYLPLALDRLLRKAVIASGGSRNQYITNLIARHLEERQESGR